MKQVEQLPCNGHLPDEDCLDNIREIKKEILASLAEDLDMVINRQNMTETPPVAIVDSNTVIVHTPECEESHENAVERKTEKETTVEAPHPSSSSISSVLTSVTSVSVPSSSDSSAVTPTGSGQTGIDSQAYSSALNVTVNDSQCVVQSDGSKRWQCLDCSKSYTTKHNLIIHVMGHRGIKPHCCLLCGKLFKQLSHLQTHMLIHANTKPHTCTVCNKSFTQVSYNT